MQSNKKAIVLWTGGKDCNLALHEAKETGFEIVRLVTFLIGEKKLRAHPSEVMEQQAKSLEIPYEFVLIEEPYDESYEKEIALLKEKYGIDTIVTGDIAEVNGNSNWITERCKSCGVDVFLPLWHLDRKQILQKMINLKFNIVFSCVKEPWFTKDWLGRELNEEAVDELEIIHKDTGLDICGENGEYHTLVVNGPGYTTSIEIGNWSILDDNGVYLLVYQR